MTQFCQKRGTGQVNHGRDGNEEKFAPSAIRKQQAGGHSMPKRGRADEGATWRRSSGTGDAGSRAKAQTHLTSKRNKGVSS